MAFLFERKHDKDGKQAAKWYSEYKNEHGDAVRVPLSESKATAQRLLIELVRKAELVAAGIVDHFADARKTLVAAIWASSNSPSRRRGETRSTSG